VSDPIYEGLGTVVKILGNNNYEVEVGEGEAVKTVLCHLRGKMQRFRINVIPGDEVTVEVPPPYDRGRIIFRGKKEDWVARGAGNKQAKRRKKGKGSKRR
jgi:translation initiation factor IF-1